MIRTAVRVTSLCLLQLAVGGCFGGGGGSDSDATDSDVPPTLADDAVPSLSIGDINVTEDTGTASLAVTLSAASGTLVSVSYTTVDGTAVAGSDYTIGSGSVTIDPAETSVLIDVVIVDDLLDEADESFTVVLSAPINAMLAGAIGLLCGGVGDGHGPLWCA